MRGGATKRNQSVACMLELMTNRKDARTSVDLPADQQRVWESLTTDEGLAKWMGEGASLDPTVGGEATFPDPVGGRERCGRIERVEPGRLLTYTWWPADDEDDASLVSIELTPLETGTRVDVAETAVQASASRSRSAATATNVQWHWRAAMLAVAGTIALAAR